MIEAKYDKDQGRWILKRGREVLGEIVPRNWVYHLVLPHNKPHPVEPAERREDMIREATNYLNK